MEKIASDLTKLIGNTPLLELSRYGAAVQAGARLLAKLECFNPCSSAKDRVGYAMIEEAQRQGLLKPGSVIIEPTSGNTGVGLAFVAAIKGYPLILTMPETMSHERMALLAALGARLVLTPGEKGMSGSIEKARELAKEYESAFLPMQFDNSANPAAHKATTGPGYRREGGPVCRGSGDRRHSHRRGPIPARAKPGGNARSGGAGRIPGPLRREGGPPRLAGNRRGFRTQGARLLPDR